MNTKPEKQLRSALWARGLRYRINYRILGRGKADLAFVGAKVAVFIDGCFWHGCPDHYTTPRSKRQFWAEKLLANVERDRRHTRALEANDWLVVRLWEHEVDEHPSRACDTVVTAVRLRRARSQPAWRVLRTDPLDERGDLERRVLVDLRDDELRHAVEGLRNSR